MKEGTLKYLNVPHHEEEKTLRAINKKHFVTNKTEDNTEPFVVDEKSITSRRYLSIKKNSFF